MPRTARRESATNFYHVVTRGVNKRAMFEDDEDRMRFLALLGQALADTGGALHAWCLMTNHVHLLLEMSLDQLAACMKHLNQGYAMYFNGKYGRTGHLYQQRYHSDPVETEPYLLTVTRYIHQNPIKAFMVPDYRYRWSSFGQYLGLPSPIPCQTETILGAFGGLAEFLEFHSTIAFDDRCLEVQQQMSDEEARGYAEKVIGKDKLLGIRDFGKDERDRLLRTLKCCMLPNVQIARITGLSTSMVSRA